MQVELGLQLRKFLKFSYLSAGNSDGDEISLRSSNFSEDESFLVVRNPASFLGIVRLRLVDSLLFQRHEQHILKMDVSSTPSDGSLSSFPLKIELDQDQSFSLPGTQETLWSLPCSAVSSVVTRVLDTQEILSQVDCFRKLTEWMRMSAEPNVDAEASQRSEVSGTEHVRTEIVSNLKEIVPEMTQIFNETESDNEDSLLTVLDFCHVLYGDVTAVTKTLYLYHGAGMAFFASFRTLLDRGRLFVKEQTLKVILQMVQTYHKNGKFESTESPPILEFILSADLDSYFINCLHLNQKPMFNDVIEILQILLGIPTFPKDRIQTTLDRSLRVAHLIITEDGVDRDKFFHFVWKAFETWDPVLPLPFEVRIMALFESLLFRTSTEPEDEICVHFAQFVNIVIKSDDILRRVREQGSLDLFIKLLKIQKIREAFASILLESNEFVKFLDESLIFSDALTDEVALEEFEIAICLMEIARIGNYTGNEMICTERIQLDLSQLAVFLMDLPLTCLKHTLPPVLAFFTANLKDNFQNPLVKVMGLETPNGKRMISDAMNQIEIVLQNFGFRTSLTEEEDGMIWETLVEIQNFAVRQRELAVEEQETTLPNFFENYFGKLSTQYFLHSFLSYTTALKAPATSFVYLHSYVELLTQNKKSCNDEGGLEGLDRLQGKAKTNFVKFVCQWLKDAESLPVGSTSANAEKRTQLATYINNLHF